MANKIFINRRSGKDRRRDYEQRQNPRLDLSCRRRRREPDRRVPARELRDDFYASLEGLHEFPPVHESKH
ncbi:MAG: hypothetical protein JKY66_01935 [Spongiibacteraceae bacterium]|nr:hypothetical protein [Spongiibacteraceae bacterium]